MLNSMTISVVGHEIATSEYSKPYACYRTVVIYKGKAFERTLRYSDFHHFYIYLTREEKKALNLKFPRKFFRKSSNLKEKRMILRETEFNTMVNRIVKIDLTSETKKALFQLLSLPEESNNESENLQRNSEIPTVEVEMNPSQSENLNMIEMKPIVRIEDNFFSEQIQTQRKTVESLISSSTSIDTEENLNVLRSPAVVKESPIELQNEDYFGEIIKQKSKINQLLTEEDEILSLASEKVRQSLSSTLEKENNLTSNQLNEEIVPQTPEVEIGIDGKVYRI